MTPEWAGMRLPGCLQGGETEEFVFNSSLEPEQQTRVPAAAYFCRTLSEGIFLSTTATLALNALCGDASTFSLGDGMVYLILRSSTLKLLIQLLWRWACRGTQSLSCSELHKQGLNNPGSFILIPTLPWADKRASLRRQVTNGESKRWSESETPAKQWGEGWTNSHKASEKKNLPFFPYICAHSITIQTVFQQPRQTQEFQYL